MKVIILGGGASGLMAALSAARDARNTVTILERQSRVGRKLLATGNGRCNLANLQLSPARYHGQDPAFAQAALTRFGVQDTLEFFRGLGLLTVAEDSGRVYPLSDQANSVLDVLRFAAEQAGVQTVCSFDAQSVRKKARGYQLTAADGTGFFADRLIIACGGCAGKALGGTMAGYDLLGQLGHSRTELLLDLLRAYPEPQVLALLAARKAALPQLPAEDALAGMLHPRLGKTLCRACGLGQQPLAGVPDEALAALAKKIKNFALPVTGVSGFESAQVTAGGVRTAEFRADTLESRLAPGVFACGEVLDIDGDCGGYNLQWAWSSGYVAGMLGKQEEPR